MRESGKKIKVKYKSALPIWAAAAVWIIGAVFFPMYSVTHYIVIAAFSCAAGFIVWRIKPYHEELRDAPVVKSNTGNAELDRVADGLTDAVRRLAPLENEDDAELSVTVAEIRETITKITEDLQKDPSDLKPCRRLLTNYIPTVLKLADKYVFLSSQNTDSKIAGETMLSIKGAFASVKELLKKQLDALYENDALDISTDITVLETMLRRDGLE